MKSALHLLLPNVFQIFDYSLYNRRFYNFNVFVRSLAKGPENGKSKTNNTSLRLIFGIRKYKKVGANISWLFARETPTVNKLLGGNVCTQKEGDGGQNKQKIIK